MPEVEHRGCRLWYTVDGPAGAPALVLSNSLGSTADLWAPQLRPFAAAFRVIRYDIRGHGRSTAPPGPCPLELLGGDALAVLDAAGAARAHVCGISLGGLTALWLGLHAPERVGRLVLAATGARIGTPELWNRRIEEVRAGGMAAIVPGLLERWFTAGFREREPGVVEAFAAMLRAASPEGYAACCAAVRDADLRADLGRITAPALVISGRDDQATPPALGRALCLAVPAVPSAPAMPRARYLELPAAHLLNVEAAEAFTRAVLEFLAP